MTPEKPISSRVPQEVHLLLPIEAMSTDEKLNLLSQFLTLENRYLRDNKAIAPEAKMQFIIAYDVTKATDFNGDLIHTRYKNNPKEAAPKFGEGLEAIGAISRYFEDFSERKNLGLSPPSKANVINEITDVVYCLANLVTLDPNQSALYKEHIDWIAKAMGLSRDDLLTFTIIKYNFRMGQGKSIKNHAMEDKIFEEVLGQKNLDGTPKYHIPTNPELIETFSELTDVIDSLWRRHNTMEKDHRRIARHEQR